MPKRLQLLCIYLGGFLGPFLGQSLVAILPDVAASFDITVQAAAFGITAFLLPFSITMLFSSRLVHGRRLDRIVLLAYVVMATGAIVLAVSDSWPTFVIVYAAMGIANAFTLPLLQTILKSVTPPDELATAISTYAAMQSLGLLSAPLVSGVLADVTNWQYVYFLVAAVLLVILIIRLPQAHPRGGVPAEAGQTPFVALAVYCLCCFAIGFGVIGVGTLVALRANTQMGLSATGAGLVVACGGTAAFLFVRFVGRFADHHGVKKVLIYSLIVSSVGVFLLAVAPGPVMLAACWAAATLACQGVQTCVNVLVLNNPRGSAFLSTVQAFRFFGISATPAVLIPVFGYSVAGAFLLPAVVVLVTLGIYGAAKARGDGVGRRPHELV